MREEVEANLPRARVGQGSKYREAASYVLKILPEMDRDRQHVDHRMRPSAAARRKRGWLSRREFPPGTAGYLYLQARALLSGVENQPPAKSAISLTDFDIGEPPIVGVERSLANKSMKLSAKVPALYRRPSDRELMARMGTAMLSGMAAAFSCEVGMKAILMTRSDAAEKSHDLLKLYEELPPDSRERLEADFPGIRWALEHNRNTFGRWRYFEQAVGEHAITALVNTDRVRQLSKAARVIVDECVVVGLNFDVQIDTTIRAVVDRGPTNLTEWTSLSVEGGESAIPWEAVLDSGRDEP